MLRHVGMMECGDKRSMWRAMSGSGRGGSKQWKPFRKGGGRTMRRK